MEEPKLTTLIGRHSIRSLLHRSILLVEDELPNLMVLRGALEDRYQVHEAHSAAEGLEIAQRVDLDIVITDQRMPQMTGIDMLEKLRTFKPDVAGILLTGYTDTPALISAINRARVFRYLKKPWQIEEVLETVALASTHVHQQRAILRLAEELSNRNAELGKALADLEVAQEQMLQLERVGMVGRLTAGVVHDLRNVVTGLMFLDADLAELGLPRERIGAVSVQLGGLRNLLGTLETMHNYVRTKRLQVEVTDTAAQLIVDDAVAVTRLDLDFRQRDVSVRVEHPMRSLMVDRPKLVQVLVNLIRNAVQATARGQAVVIEVATRGREVVFAVEDSGAGVPAEARASLFQPFISTKGEEGLGMGLYMSRLVVESHRGRLVHVDRGSRTGARFEVVLPL